MAMVSSGCMQCCKLHQQDPTAVTFSDELDMLDADFVIADFVCLRGVYTPRRQHCWEFSVKFCSQFAWLNAA